MIGFLYEYRLGLDLLTPPPLPEPEVAPEARAGIVPKLCVGYLPEDKQWGYIGGNCPKNYAFVANLARGGKHKTGPAEFVPLIGLCCALPADDILTDRHVYNEFEECPDQYVATGGGGKECQVNCSMRCTQINTKKYKLGVEHRSYYVRFAGGGRLHGQGSAAGIFWKQLPTAIRYAVGRISNFEWQRQSCLGYPLGALFTRKSGKRCDSFFYRQLQYLDSTPVKIFPDCAAVSDGYSSNPKCLAADEAGEAVVVIPFPRNSGKLVH